MDRKEYKILITKLIMAILCIAATAVSCIFLLHLPKFILIIILAAFAAMAVGISCVDTHRFEWLYKALICTIILAVISLGAYIILDATGVLDKITSFDMLKDLILESKQWGVIVFLLITIFEVVVLPIPAMVTVLIGVAIYGPLWSFILSSIGTILGSIIAFALGKVFGKKLVVWMIGKEKTEKYAAVLNEKGRLIFFLMLLFPCFPDDILCIVAGITSMSYWYFIGVTCLTRPVMIAVYSFFGSGSIIPFSGWGIPVWIALFVVALIVFILLSRLKNKFLGSKSKKVSRRAMRAESETAEDLGDGVKEAVRPADNSSDSKT